ncbi:MAG: hypothetical protein PHR28_10920 [candidate division Zixibacteria bacterium]|jgi:hypothetical protein|nr:hypothetical protein [candidate division Zixibacteria bacterium]
MRAFALDEGKFGKTFDRVGNEVTSRLTDTAIVNLTRLSRPNGTMRLESGMDQGINQVVDTICDTVISPDGQESSGLATIAQNVERLFR